MPAEFELIEKYFAPLGGAIGDDCAVLDVPEHHQLVVSTDSQVEGIHFPEKAPPEKLARRALGAAISDLAAAGAKPLGVTLALTIPAASDPWLEAFSNGLKTALQHFSVELIGGDTSQGQLNINFTVMGCVPKGEQLLRSGAKVDDSIYVTGTLGDAHAALHNLLDQCSPFSAAYWQPNPPLALAQTLRGVASAAIDISDGLLADLGHICTASRVGALIEPSAVPISQALSANGFAEYALNGGDDYQLCFTAPSDQIDVIDALAGEFNLRISRIGTVVQGCGIANAQGGNFALPVGYSHFSAQATADS